LLLRSAHARSLAPMEENIYYYVNATFTVPGPDGHQQVLLQTPNPTLALRHGRPDRTYLVLSDEEFDRFFAVIPTDTVKGLLDRAIFLLYFCTARRREDIARLRWGDIEQGVIVDEGGRRRQGWRYRFRGKGKRGEEDIAELPEPAKIAIALRRMRNWLALTHDGSRFTPGGTPLLSSAMPRARIFVHCRGY
jgi:integrase